MSRPVRPRGADGMKKPIAAAAEATYREMKKEFKNQTRQGELDIVIQSLRRNFTNIKVMYDSLETFLNNMDTMLSEKEEYQLWAIEALLEQQLNHLESYIDGASRFLDEVQK
jgi:hypothetical protein